MRRVIFLGIIALVLGVVACSSSSTSGPTKHVYIAGQVGATDANNNTLPVYWKDGVLTFLPLTSNHQYGWTDGITEDSSGNIYVVGGQYGTGGTINGYWKNSTFITATNTNGYPVIWQQGISVDPGGNVWVAAVGAPSSPPTSGGTAFYWENGGAQNVISSGVFDSGLHVDESGNVHISGETGASQAAWIPTVWKNGVTATPLPLDGVNTNGYVSQVALDSSGNLYASGVLFGTSSKPVFWKAVGGVWGAPTALPMGSTYASYTSWDVEDVAVDDSGNVDVVAFIAPSGSATDMVFWKGASSTPTALNLNGNAYFYRNKPGLAGVDDQGNLFIAGVLGATSGTAMPVYWENGGNPVFLTVGSGNLYGCTDGVFVGP